MNGQWQWHIQYIGKEISRPDVWLLTLACKLNAPSPLLWEFWTLRRWFLLFLKENKFSLSQRFLLFFTILTLCSTKKKTRGIILISVLKKWCRWKSTPKFWSCPPHRLDAFLPNLLRQPPNVASCKDFITETFSPPNIFSLKADFNNSGFTALLHSWGCHDGRQPHFWMEVKLCSFWSCLILMGWVVLGTLPTAYPSLLILILPNSHWLGCVGYSSHSQSNFAQSGLA